MSGIYEQANSVPSEELGSTAIRVPTPSEGSDIFTPSPDSGTSSPSPGSNTSTPSPDSGTSTPCPTSISTWKILKTLVSAIVPLRQREKEQQISLYAEHPDFISYIPQHQLGALHAVQAHAPTNLSIELMFYRNILPCTLQKMIDFKKALAILDKAPSYEQMQLIHQGKLDPYSMISVDPLTDEDVYVAHVIAVNYLMQKIKLQKRAEKSPLMMDEQHDIEEPQLSYPCGQQSYAATVSVHHALSMVLPSGLVNGVISNLAHTFNDVSQPREASYAMRRSLFQLLFDTTGNTLCSYTIGSIGSMDLVGMLFIQLSAVSLGILLKGTGATLAHDAKASYEYRSPHPDTLDAWKQQAYEKHQETLIQQALKATPPAVQIQALPASEAVTTVGSEPVRTARYSMLSII